MNRPTAILVALATLVAHVMALHQNAEGTFAPPYEVAHVAFRAARNLVYEGTLAWNTGGAVVESYPSPLWVGLSAAAQALYLSPTLASQLLGIACSLLTVIVLASFSANRLAGLIALLLFVVTGTTAAASAAGTEHPLVMLLVALGFLGFERRSFKWTAVGLGLLVLARTELWILVVGLAAAELLSMRSRRESGEPVLLKAFLVPAGVVALLAVLRAMIVGSPLSATTLLLFDFDGERMRLGLDYVLSFYTRSGAAALVVFPLWYLARGQLSGTGRRAMGLVGLWTVFIAVVGGDGLPFWMAMAPAVPPLYLAVQEAMIIAMDSRRRGLSPLTWVLFVVCVLMSGLVSRVPTDIGGLPFKSLHQRWMTPSELYEDSYRRQLGRRGLMAEIEEVEQLRSLGVFLRDRLDVGTSVLTPWPGAVGYISRQRVLDLFGRATRPADGSAQRSWYGVPRLDIPKSIAAGADYILPVARTGATPPRVGEVVRHWIGRNHEGSEAGAAVKQGIASLRDYELISVPVPVRSYRPDEAARRPFYLLRNEKLRLQPRLSLERSGDAVDVFAKHRGHRQIVDLEVTVVDADDPEGRVLRLRPTGELVAQDLVHARSGILLHATAQEPIHLMRFRLPDDIEAADIAAVLQNPNSGEDPLFSLVSEPAKVEYRR